MKKRVWHRVNTTGDTPAKRTDHSVVLHNRSALLYAGFDGRQRYNDLQELKLTEGRWVPLTSRTGAPRSRFAHSAVMYRESMIIFAGWDGHDTLQELYEYDAATQFWSLRSRLSLRTPALDVLAILVMNLIKHYC